MISRLFSNETSFTTPQVVAIAGTHGKTITGHLLTEILKHSGKRVGSILTTGIDFEGNTSESNANDISRKDLRKTLSAMFHRGIEITVLEVTVENLKKGIYKGIVFDSAIITNIQGDPKGDLTWDQYSKHLLQVLLQLKENAVVVMNADETDTRLWLQSNSDTIQQQIYVYWASSNNTYNHNFSLTGSEVEIGGIAPLQTKLLGHFNLLNLYQASKLALHYTSIQYVVDALKNLNAPKGKLDKIYEQPFTVVLDHALDPSHLWDALSFLQSAKSPSNRLISVVGAKGNSKNIPYHIGGISAELSDLVLITSNDPIYESTATINQKTVNHAFEKGANLVHSFANADDVQNKPKQTILERIQNVMSHSLTPILSFDHEDFKGRLDAIYYAFSLAAPGDIVFIGGKGHEKSIRYKDIEYEWSDYEAARIAMDRVMRNSRR